MRHLTPGELIDLAEGTRDARSMPHLAACDVCRRQLTDLRAAMADVSGGADIPEPSPLFWDHLSARVRDGVRNEDMPVRASALGSFLSAPRLAVAAVWCVVVIAIGAAFGSRLIAPRSQAPVVSTGLGPAEHVHHVPATTSALLGPDDDASLSLVADYGKTLDWDELREQMSTSDQRGSLDATVSELNAAERRELRRLLTEELARRAAGTDRS